MGNIILKLRTSGKRNYFIIEVYINSPTIPTYLQYFPLQIEGKTRQEQEVTARNQAKLISSVNTLHLEDKTTL